jgi:hypothetical protein
MPVRCVNDRDVYSLYRIYGLYGMNSADTVWRIGNLLFLRVGLAGALRIAFFTSALLRNDHLC